MARAGDGKPRSEKRKREHLVQKRVNDEELSRFIERAHVAGFEHHNDFLSAFILGDVEIERRERRELTKILGELGKQGSNLNQLLTAVHSGQISTLSDDELQAVRDTQAEIKAAGDLLRSILL